MAVKMLGYFERSSVIHQLSGVTKLIIFLLWSTAAMLTYDTRILLVLLIFSFVIFKLSKVRLREISLVLALILFFLLLNNLAIYLFSPKKAYRFTAVRLSSSQSMGAIILQLSNYFITLM